MSLTALRIARYGLLGFTAGALAVATTGLGLAIHDRQRTHHAARRRGRALHGIIN